MDANLEEKEEDRFEVHIIENGLIDITKKNNSINDVKSHINRRRMIDRIIISS